MTDPVRAAAPAVTPSIARRPRDMVRLRLLVVVVVGLVAFVVRAAYAFDGWPALFSKTDNTWYVGVAQSIAEGHFGRIPGVEHERVWSFRFPPAYPVTLGLGQKLLFWVKPLDADRWTSVALGTVASVSVAGLAWRIADSARRLQRAVAALVAGLAFALNPLTAGPSAALMSEALFLPVMALVLLLTDRLLIEDEISTTTALGLVVLLVIGTLTRAEGLVYLGAPVVAALCMRRSALRVAAVALAAGVVAAVAWSAWASVVVGRPAFMTTNGSPLLGANCKDAQYGEAKGYWNVNCLPLPPSRLSRRAERAIAAPVAWFTLAPALGPEVEGELNRAQFSAGLDEIRSRPEGVLQVIPFRLARALGVHWSTMQSDHETFEGRNRSWEAVGRVVHIVVVLPLALVGLAAVAFRKSRLGRRWERVADRRRLFPSLALLAVWLVSIMVTYGSTRLRAPVEPSLAVLAGLAAAMLPARLAAAD